jgi:hypothetical protein
MMTWNRMDVIDRFEHDPAFRSLVDLMTHWLLGQRLRRTDRGGGVISVWLSPDESGWLVSKRPAFPAGLYWAKFRTQAEADSFRALLAYRATLAADSKGADYEQDGVEYSNLTAAEQWGIPAWKYAMNRVDEKLNRLKSYAQGSTLQHEGARDSMIDIAVLSLIAIVLKERAETKQLDWITTHQQQQEGSNHAEVSN